MSGIGKEQSYLLSPRRKHFWEMDKDESSDTHTCPLHLCCSWGPGSPPLAQQDPSGSLDLSPSPYAEMETQRPGWGGDRPAPQKGRVELPSAA